MVALGEHFRTEGPGRASEWARQRQWFIKAKHDHQRREEIADRAEDSALTAVAAATTLATTAQIKAFEVKLDTYDAATVEALMDNQELLDAIDQRLEIIRQQKQGLLDHAYILEDGRRVFKAEDGSFVIDEDGQDVSTDEVDFDLINGPSAEGYMSVLSAEAELEEQRETTVQQRSDILEIQEKLDEAREEIADGEITEAELEDLDAELMELMPTSVRKNVTGMEVSEPTTGQEQFGTSAEIELGVDPQGGSISTLEM